MLESNQRELRWTLALVVTGEWRNPNPKTQIFEGEQGRWMIVAAASVVKDVRVDRERASEGRWRWRRVGFSGCCRASKGAHAFELIAIVCHAHAAQRGVTRDRHGLLTGEIRGVDLIAVLQSSTISAVVLN